MYFDSLGEFFAMGKHGFYVWTAYGVFLLVAIWNWWTAVQIRKTAVRAVAREIQRRCMAESEGTTFSRSRVNSETGDDTK